MMKTRTLVILAAAMAVASEACAAPPVVRNLGPLKLGAAGDSAVTALGKPADISTDFEVPPEQAPAGALRYKLCEDTDLLLLVGKIAPEEARIVQIAVQGKPCDQSAAYAINGIGLGSTETQLIGKFGAPDRVIEREGLNAKTVAYEDSNIAFTLEKGVVTGLSVVYRNRMMAEDLVAEKKITAEEAWSQLGDMRLRGRQFELAMEAFQNVIKANPKSATGQLRLGAVHFAMGDMDQAEKSFKAVIALEPGNAVAIYNLGRVAMRQKKPDEARSLLTRASNLDPKNAAAFNELGLLEESQNQLDAAEKNFRQAATLAPNASQPHQNLGRIMVQKGDKLGAIEEYSKAYVLEVQSPNRNDQIVHALQTALQKLRDETKTAAKDLNPLPGGPK